MAKDAKSKGMRVGIAIHIPPGLFWLNNMKQGWNSVYMKNFSDIVRTHEIQFILVGHVHNDLLLPIAPDGDDRAYGLCAPAASTCSGGNPAFRVMQYCDGKLGEVFQYYADISENPKELKWELECKFSEVYGEKDSTPGGLSKVADKVLDSHKEMWKYRERLERV
jgi:hypothetical protein